MELHPDFLEKTLSVKHDELVNEEEWSALLEQLNSVPGGPVLSKQHWNARLQDWRHSLNKKYRKIIVDVNSTGGGPSTAKPLKDYELRALNIFNATTTTGNRDLLIEAGISRQFQLPEEPLDHSSDLAAAQSHEEHITDENTDSNRQATNVRHSTASVEVGRSRSRRQRRERSRSPSSNSSNVAKYLSKIEEMEQRKSESQRELVQEVCSSINNFAGAISALAEAISFNQNNSNNS